MDKAGLVSGVLQGIAAGQQRYYQIKAAQQQLEQQRETFDLQKKKTKAELELAEKRGQKMDLEREQFEAQAKMIGSLHDFYEKGLKQKEQQNKQVRENANAFAKGLSIDVGGQRYDLDPEELAQGSVFPFDKAKSGSKARKEEFQSDLEKAISYQTAKEEGTQPPAGSMTWDALKHKYQGYPDLLKEAEESKNSFVEPLEKSPEFSMGSGWPISKVRSWLSPQQAELPPADAAGGLRPRKETMDVIEQIKPLGKEGLKELIERRREAEAIGADVDFILEYFGYTVNKNGELEKINKGALNGRKE